MTSESHRRRISHRTSAEHEAIVKALHTLERALASPVPGREREWKRRAAAALAVVVDEVAQHRESAEGGDGLLAQVEVTAGRTRGVSLTRAEHARLTAAAGELLAQVEDGIADAGFSCDEMRRKAHALATALRRHQSREADLLFTALGQDIGAGD